MLLQPHFEYTHHVEVPQARHDGVVPAGPGSSGMTGVAGNHHRHRIADAHLKLVGQHNGRE